MRMNVAADGTDAQALPHDKKSDSDKDLVYKDIAKQLDKIANEIELAYSLQPKTGQLLTTL